MEEIIQQMLSNQINMRAFLALVNSNPNLINTLNALIPEDSKNNPKHPIWSKYSYDAMEKVAFDLWNEINRIALFDDSLGDNLNIFGIIRTFYCYSHPDFQCTKKYNEEFSLLLDVAGESYGGPEVDKLINDIISQCVSITPKTRRIRESKEKLAFAFHVSEKKRPHWINGAEWPMGKKSPMRFTSQSKEGELVRFTFKDVDTGEQKVVEQFY